MRQGGVGGSGQRARPLPPGPGSPGLRRRRQPRRGRKQPRLRLSESIRVKLSPSEPIQLAAVQARPTGLGREGTHPCRGIRVDHAAFVQYPASETSKSDTFASETSKSDSFAGPLKNIKIRHIRIRNIKIRHIRRASLFCAGPRANRLRAGGGLRAGRVIIAVIITIVCDLFLDQPGASCARPG
jgi:hypothetical protein